MKINGNSECCGGGGVINPLSVSSNGTYNPPIGVDGYAPVEVDVEFVTEQLSVSENGTYNPGEGVDGFSQVVVSVPQSVQGYTLDQIINGTLPGATSINSTITELMTGGCWGTVETVNLPDCEYIADMAFYSCHSLRTVSAPVCYEIGRFEFMNCTSLSELNMLALTYVPKYAFAGCAALASVSFPAAELVEEYAFALDFGLSEAYLPACTSIGSSAFYRCSALSSLTVTAVKYIGDNAFTQCNGLTEVTLPNCASIMGFAFMNCNNLVSVSLPQISNLQNQVFYGCSNFSQLTIGTNWYVIPRYMNQLDATAFASGTGSIYVDATMYDKWVASQGWSSFASLFVSVGDPAIPMISLSDGVLYGKTKIMGDQYVMQQNTGINPNQISVVSLGSCLEVQAYAFQMNNNITAVDLPECTQIRRGAFMNCSNLNTVSLPNCSYIEYGAFARTGITSISLPNCIAIGDAIFEMDNALTDVYLGSNCSVIGNHNFNFLPNLSKFTVAYSAGVCVLGNQNNNFVSTTSIFVPASLVDAYKVANRWSQYSSQIFPIE